MNALDLANSFTGERGQIRDALDARLGLHELRDVIRSAFGAATEGSRPAAAIVAKLNAVADTPQLRWGTHGPRLVEEEASEAARTAIELIASGRLRRCGNPRCILFFLGQGRRAYCSATCANRTRVARHAARRG